MGDSSASPTTALLLSVVHDSAGRLATILFAHRLGTALEPECKMYRLAADIFNDTAMVLDCLSPVFPKAARIAVLSFSSCLRALCGVCAGSAKASLSAHFAKRGNLGEVNAVSSHLAPFFSIFSFLRFFFFSNLCFFWSLPLSPPPPSHHMGPCSGVLGGFLQRSPQLPTYPHRRSPLYPFLPTSSSARERVWGLGR